MGFKFWYEAVIFVTIFAVIIIVPCYFLATMGSKMINEMGNYPSKAEAIVGKTLWVAVAIVIATLIALSIFFQVFS